MRHVRILLLLLGVTIGTQACIASSSRRLAPLNGRCRLKLAGCIAARPGLAREGGAAH